MKPAPLPPRAKAELTATLAHLQRKNKRTLLHYLVAAGPDKRDANEDVVRLVLVKARDGAIVPDAALWRLYAKDAALDADNHGKYKLSRGLVRIADGKVQLVPSSKNNAQRSEGPLRALFRQLDEVTSPVFSNPGFKVLAKAPIEAPQDPALVFRDFAQSPDEDDEPQARPQAPQPKEAPVAKIDTRSADAALASWKRYGKDLPATIVEVYAMTAEDPSTREGALQVVKGLVRDLAKHDAALAAAIDVIDDHEGDPVADRLLAQLGAAVAEIDSLDTELEGVIEDLSVPVAEPRAFADAVERFEAAQDDVDRQIGRLQSKLKSSGDSELVEIAELGLNALTGDFRVPLKAALLDVNKVEAKDREKARKRARETARAYLAHLESDEAIAACDDNPFGVDVRIRETLAGPLRTLVAAAA